MKDEAVTISRAVRCRDRGSAAGTLRKKKKKKKDKSRQWKSKKKQLTGMTII